MTLEKQETLVKVIGETKIYFFILHIINDFYLKIYFIHIYTVLREF